VAEARDQLPKPIIVMIEQGALIQWRKFPFVFIVPGIEKARLKWDKKKKVLLTLNTDPISLPNGPDRVRFARFAKELSQMIKDQQ
jgi:hypothetical protein